MSRVISFSSMAGGRVEEHDNNVSWAPWYGISAYPMAAIAMYSVAAKKTTPLMESTSKTHVYHPRPAH